MCISYLNTLIHLLNNNICTYISKLHNDGKIDYIQNFERETDMIENYNKNTKTQNSLDDMYNEIQTPLLLALLYFLFQLPFFKKILFNNLPKGVFFSNDGNLNINGLLGTSSLFGITFYFLLGLYFLGSNLC